MLRHEYRRLARPGRDARNGRGETDGPLLLPRGTGALGRRSRASQFEQARHPDGGPPTFWSRGMVRGDHCLLARHLMTAIGSNAQATALGGTPPLQERPRKRPWTVVVPSVPMLEA